MAKKFTTWRFFSNSDLIKFVNVTRLHSYKGGGLTVRTTLPPHEVRRYLNTYQLHAIREND